MISVSLEFLHYASFIRTKADLAALKYCCASPSRNCCTISTFAFGNTGVAYKAGFDQILQELASANSSTSTQSTIIVTVTAAPASDSTASASTVPPNSSASTNNLGPKIGLAVGVPVGALALGLLGFILWRMRTSSGMKAEAPIEMTGNPYYHHTSLQPPPSQEVPVEVPVGAFSRSEIGGQDQKSPGIYGGPAGVHE